MARSEYAKQFRPGTYPDQHWDESTRVNGHEADSPSKSRSRLGVALGFESQANPGMAGKNDYPRDRKR